MAEYSGAEQRKTAELFADDVFATLRTGASLVTSDGQAMRLLAAPGVRPDRAMVGRLGLRPTPHSSVPVDCPANLNCQFVPAAYAEDPGGSPYNYGDYDIAARPRDLRINSIVIHDTESSYADAIATFQNPASYVSANYVIQSSTGDITEMVRPQDVAWAVGDWYYNTHSISIEHEGYAAQGSVWYTQVMYKASAELVRYLAHRFGVPLNREHIVGHDNIPGPTDAYTAAQHWDPGPFWNWNYYMSLLHGITQRAELATAGSASPSGHHVVTMDPNFATNKPPVIDCSSGTCQGCRNSRPTSSTCTPSPASAAPAQRSDAASERLGGESAGQRLGRQGPDRREIRDRRAKRQLDRHLVRRRDRLVLQPAWGPGRPRATPIRWWSPEGGVTSVPVFGSAYPEASAYPKVVPVQPNAPMALQNLARPGIRTHWRRSRRLLLRGHL